jgi:hypothetical protein
MHTYGRNSLHEWSSSSQRPLSTTHNKYKISKSIPSAGFEPEEPIIQAMFVRYLSQKFLNLDRQTSTMSVNASKRSCNWLRTSRGKLITIARHFYQNVRSREYKLFIGRWEPRGSEEDIRTLHIFTLSVPWNQSHGRSEPSLLPRHVSPDNIDNSEGGVGPIINNWWALGR